MIRRTCALRLLVRAAALAALLAASAGPATADAGLMTFSQFKEDPDSTGSPFVLTSSAAGSVLQANVRVSFSFLGISDPLLPTGEIEADLIFLATASADSNAFGFSNLVFQDFETGSLEFRRVSDGASLLQVSFGGGLLGGGRNSGAGTLSASSETDGQSVVFSSDFLLFDNSPTGQRDLALSFSAITPGLTIVSADGRSYLRGFEANGTGTFSATGVQVVPEPSTAVLTSVGLVALGVFTVRRRRRRWLALA